MPPENRQPLSDRRDVALVSVAVGPCGCGYGIECNNDEYGQATVARWESEGATIERLPIEAARARVTLDCLHEPAYGLLPTSEARAEVLRLRAEMREAVDSLQNGLVEDAIQRLLNAADDETATDLENLREQEGS
jgi:hypothetical protein